MQQVTVYIKPGSAPCDAILGWLDSRGVAYEAHDLTEDPKAFSAMRGLGHFQAPVVVTATEHWAGFRPDKLANLAFGA